MWFLVDGHDYPSLLDAARGILIDACSTLATINLDYVVAGGWVPYLRAKGNRFVHPGTKDVDLLFNDEPERISAAVKQLLGTGYALSAKHDFQLLKEVIVGGQRFVFNVDLMHPAEAEKQPDLFQDIFDLGVYDDYDRKKTHIVKSIVFPSSRIVFDESLWSQIDVTATLPNGEVQTFPIPLMDEAALILSKCVSVKEKKRRRDAFDIFFVLSGSNRKSIIAKLKKMASDFPQVSDQLAELRSFIKNEPDKFNAHVLDYIELESADSPPADCITKALFT